MTSAEIGQYVSGLEQEVRHLRAYVEAIDAALGPGIDDISPDTGHTVIDFRQRWEKRELRRHRG